MGWARSRAAALALLASVMAAACGNASEIAANDTFATSSTTTTGAQAASDAPTLGGPPPTPHPHTPPIDFDPIAPLPVTDATDRLVVSTIGDDQPPLLLIDLGRLDVVPLTDATATRVDAAFGGTALAYTIDDRTLGIIADIDDPGSTVRAALPDDVPGVITGLTGDAEGFVARSASPSIRPTPTGGERPGPTSSSDPMATCAASPPPPHRPRGRSPCRAVSSASTCRPSWIVETAGHGPGSPTSTSSPWWWAPSTIVSCSPTPRASLSTMRRRAPACTSPSPSVTS